MKSKKEQNFSEFQKNLERSVHIFLDKANTSLLEVDPKLLSRIDTEYIYASLNKVINILDSLLYSISRNNYIVSQALFRILLDVYITSAYIFEQKYSNDILRHFFENGKIYDLDLKSGNPKEIKLDENGWPISISDSQMIKVAEKGGLEIKGLYNFGSKFIHHSDQSFLTCLGYDETADAGYSNVGVGNLDWNIKDKEDLLRNIEGITEKIIDVFQKRVYELVLTYKI